MSEHRSTTRTEPRGLVSRTGHIFLSPSAAPIECRVVNLSAGGACLELSTLPDYPNRFEFRHGGARMSCQLAWKRGYRIGIRFEAAPHRSSSSLSRPTAQRTSRFR